MRSLIDIDCSTKFFVLYIDQLRFLRFTYKYHFVIIIDKHLRFVRFLIGTEYECQVEVKDDLKFGFSWFHSWLYHCRANVHSFLADTGSSWALLDEIIRVNLIEQLTLLTFVRR